MKGIFRAVSLRDLKRDKIRTKILANLNKIKDLEARIAKKQGALEKKGQDTDVCGGFTGPISGRFLPDNAYSCEQGLFSAGKFYAIS